MSGGKSLRTRSSGSEIDAFLKQARALTPTTSGDTGRLLFALDATASREPVWDRATQIQGEMFLEASRVGNLAVKLAYYRGLGECRALPWSRNAAELLGAMTGIRCAAGQTQIARILQLALTEREKGRLDAMVFVGDCVEENPDRLVGLAGRMALLGVKLFVFQDGRDAIAERTLRELARLTGGAWSRFDAGSAAQLRDLLCAVAVYAAGGDSALKAFSRGRGDDIKRLTSQVSR